MAGCVIFGVSAMLGGLLSRLRIAASHALPVVDARSKEEFIQIVRHLDRPVIHVDVKTEIRNHETCGSYSLSTMGPEGKLIRFTHTCFTHVNENHGDLVGLLWMQTEIELDWLRKSLPEAKIESHGLVPHGHGPCEIDPYTKAKLFLSFFRLAQRAR